EVVWCSFPFVMVTVYARGAGHAADGELDLGGARSGRGAAVLLGAREGFVPEGHLPPSLERENLARATELCRAALGDEEFAAAYAEGDGLSMEEAAALLGRAADAISERAES
ncbi:hypothetical protein AB0F16_19375, partial [Streptomyces tanashiensis]|uniref:hypothetical protein n=1 Tax=Streptomyces tanashiensis TaxID=67367 RepID=UPI0034012AC5